MILRIKVDNKFKNNIDFSQILLNLRKNLDVSQSVMAEFFNVSLGSYQKWEAGERTPNGDVGYWVGVNWHWLQYLDNEKKK